MERHELDNNTFSAQFPLNAVISHLRKAFQSPSSTALLIDLLSGCLVLALTRLLSSLHPSVFCAAVPGHSERHQSDSPTPSKRPSSRSETSESPLSSKRPRTAEKSTSEQVRVTNHTILITSTSSDVLETVWEKKNLFENSR